MKRRLHGALTLSLVACMGEPTLVISPMSTPPAPPDAPQRESVTTDPTLTQLAALAVHHDDFYRPELYTWTTAAQLERLRETRCLLVAEATTGKPSPFNLALMALASDRSTTAQLATLLLEHPALTRRRYAWPSPFATALGLGWRRYGDVLIHIELDPRAFVGRFEPGVEPAFTFVDARGASVTAEQVLAEPERLAAIYHVREHEDLPYREFVVSSEAMITSWSVATPAIQTRLDHELELLDALARTTLARLAPLAIEQPAAPDWRSAPAEPTPLALWHASLAFDNSRYRPSPAMIDHIRDALRDTRTGEPLVHHPQTHPCPR